MQVVHLEKFFLSIRRKITYLCSLRRRFFYGNLLRNLEIEIEKITYQNFIKFHILSTFPPVSKDFD
jgi:hypothetical protein